MTRAAKANEVLAIARTKLIPSEHTEQVWLIQQLALMEGRYPELGLIFAVPNGGLRSKATAGKLKAEGVKPAVPDLVLPVARYPFHGLYIEMKRLGEYARPDQREYQARLLAQDYAVVTCQGAIAATAAVERYLRFKPWGRDTPGPGAVGFEVGLYTLVELDGVFVYQPPEPTTTGEE